MKSTANVGRVLRRIWMRWILAALVSGGVAAVIAAEAQLIEKVEGTIADNSEIRLTGTGFGANGPNVVIFDNFDYDNSGISHEDNQPLPSGSQPATIGAWTSTSGSSEQDCPLTPRAEYSADNQVSGDLSWHAAVTPRDSTCSFSNKDIVDDTQYAFVSYSFRSDVTWPGDRVDEDTGIVKSNWKILWMLGPGDSWNDDDTVMPLVQGPDHNVRYACNGCADSATYLGYTANLNEWNHIMLYTYATFNDGDGWRDGWSIGPNGIEDIANHGDDGPFQNDSGWDSFNLNGYARHTEDGKNSYIYYDDLYVARGPNAYARVEITNNSDYWASTKRSLCVPGSWSDDEVTCTAFEGMHEQGDQVYVHLFTAGESLSNSVGPYTFGETSVPACGDGYDNDGDGKVDYPEDADCESSSGVAESTHFSQPDPECADGEDNDGDGLWDYPNDPDCSSATDSAEGEVGSPKCSDGLDNDGDGAIDYPDDEYCVSPNDDSEAPIAAPQKLRREDVVPS